MQSARTSLHLCHPLDQDVMVASILLKQFHHPSVILLPTICYAQSNCYDIKICIVMSRFKSTGVNVRCG